MKLDVPKGPPCPRGHTFVENIGNANRARCVKCGLKVRAFWGSRGEKGWEAAK